MKQQNVLLFIALHAVVFGLPGAELPSTTKQVPKAASAPAAEKAASQPVTQARLAPGPQPGEVYKVFELHLGKERPDWRVTDPTVTNKDAQRFLPNAVHEMQIGDLEHALRVEALIDRWGGHVNTLKKSIRFNGNEWLQLPDIENTPEHPSKYHSQNNPAIIVPLEHLKKGSNSVEGYCYSYGFGHWGMYSVILRVYYDPDKKSHATARIVSPADEETLDEMPPVKVEPVEGQIQKVEVLGHYEDYDFDGDGIYDEWIGSYHQPQKAADALLENHIGSDSEAPFEVTWDTQWVPDQPEASIELIARVQNGDGVWFVTQPVAGLSLKNRKHSVQLYRATEIPTKFSLRRDKSLSCVIHIPEETDLSKAMDARLYLRTWNGTNKEHGDFTLNDLVVEGKGLVHRYALTVHDIPVAHLKKGKNLVTFTSGTDHHPLEVLWPGPALVVRYTVKATLD